MGDPARHMAALTERRMAALTEPQRRLLEKRLASLAVDMAEIPVVPGAHDGARAPLSFPQQRLWFLQQLDPADTSYNLQWAIGLEGRLDVPALERAISAIIARHEVLRTTFEWHDGDFVQVVEPASPVSLPETGLREFTATAQEQRLRDLARRRAGQSFDLGGGPPVRIDLLRLADERYRLLITLHHIISDGWSQAVLLGELGALYQAFTAGRPEPLEPLPVQYSDYAVWQRTWLSGPRLDDPLAYWRDQLADLPALRLPDGRRPGGQPPAARVAGVVSAVLPRELADRLRALGRERGATVFMTVLAGLQAVLATYSGQTDFGVGVSIANRRRPELNGLIGFFANILVLRADLAADPTFEQLVQRVRDVSLAAYEHQDLPFERLVEELRPARGASGRPLFQVLLNLDDTPATELEIPGLRVTLHDDEVGAAKSDLELTFARDEEGNLAGRLLYEQGAISHAVAEGLVGGLRRLLEEAVAHPRRRLSELDVPTCGERRRLVAELARGSRLDLPDRCVHELVAQAADRRPEAPAVIYGDEVLSYRELDRRAGLLARRLRALEVTPETPVAVCLDRSPDLVVALLGVLKAGGAYLPLDPAYPAERLLYMLTNSGADVVVAGAATEEALAGFDGAVLRLDGQDRPEPTDGAAPAPERRARPGPASQSWQPQPAHEADTRPDNLAYVIYTSGSSGRPKGVMVTHRNLVGFLRAMAAELPITDQDVILATTTVSFDIAGLEIWGALTTGACVHMAPGALSGDWREFRELAESQEITAMQGTPSTWRFLLERGWTPPPGRKLWCGGEALPADLAARLVRGGAELWNLYGPTETTVWSSLQRVTDTGEVIPIGSPIANTELYVLNRSLRPVPVGAVGELCIGGVGVVRGYLGLPDATAAKFVPDPFGGRPGGRLYRTGDLVCRRPDGSLRFLGRADQQVKIRGFRVEPGEIESVLTQHPTVANAAVTMVTGPQGIPSLVAYVQARTPEGCPGLREFIRRRLPEAMVPSRLIVLDQLPLTPNGKVNRQQLPAPSRQEATSAIAKFVAPRTPSEHACARVMASVLEVARVGVNDDFFELGGHSMLAARLTAMLEREFGIYLPLQTIFERATVANLAAIIDQVRKGSIEVGNTPGDDSLVILPAPLEAAADTALDPAISPAWIDGPRDTKVTEGASGHAILPKSADWWSIGSSADTR
jgi:amino acid adenylation domain-containing protein